jgi:UDP-glucose 4-epimerase
MMVKFDCKNFIFSSTATCYGATENGKETDLQNPINTYAMTKVTVEYLMKA